jgi:hypothetical protein
MDQINPNIYEANPYAIYQKRHNFLRIASFIISIVAMILLIISIVLMFTRMFFGSFLYYPSYILTILSIVLGAISYFGPFKVKYGLIAFIIGIVLVSIGPILFSLSSYLSVMGMMSAGPSMTMGFP